MTVLVQSSSTSTSVIVSLVSAGVEVRHAVPMILGSNVGTSVTNTIVSMTQAGDRERFRRAFAAATVHDMFNWLSVVLMLLIEISTGFLERVTGYLVDRMPLGSDEVSSPDLLKPMTKPFTDLVVKLDQEVLLGWSFEDERYANVSTLLLTQCGDDKCTHLAALIGPNGMGFSDTVVGLVLLAGSLLMLCACLLCLMKILNSVLGSKMCGIIQKTINAEIPMCPWLTGYLAMLIGAVITILVRSSSVFTSTLTPLCGAGLVTLETAYPMTLGSNIGTTTTSLLAAMAAEGKYLRPSIQIALVHLFFNVVGICIFYPVPCMRWPIPLARAMGDKTARYRWFAAAYLILAFFLLPLAVFLLSLAGLTVMYAVVGAIGIAIAIILFINLLQEKRPGVLPSFLRSWGFLPLPLRSLEPLDNLIQRMSCCCGCAAASGECCDVGQTCQDKAAAAAAAAAVDKEKKLDAEDPERENLVSFLPSNLQLAASDESATCKKGKDIFDAA